MNGKELTTIVDAELNQRGISKMDFYEATGVSSATYSQWKNGTYEPSYPKIQAIEEYLGIKLQDSMYDSDTAALREAMRTRPELKLLFESLRDAPASYIYQVLSEVSKFKERNP